MDREFLEDYNSKEYQETRDMCIKISEGKFAPDERYPPANRFSKIKKPIAVASYEASIWPQIPLFGSLIIPLMPVSENKFFKIHGFEIRHIDKLIDYSKDTGKVQFGLSASPIAYDGLDFLEKIFIELKPPTLSVPPPMSIFGYEQESKYVQTFCDLAFLRNVKTGLAPVDLLTQFMSPTPQIPEIGIIDTYVSTYVALKCLGYDKAALEIEDLLVDDPPNAWAMLRILGSILVNPMISPLKAINCFTRKFLTTRFKTETLNTANGELISFSPSKFNPYEAFERLEIDTSKISFQYDIGKLLMEKLTHTPESFDACKSIIDDYRQEDLYILMEALDKGVKKANIDLVNAKANEISTVFDNLWESKVVSRYKSGTSIVTSVGLGVVGTMAGGIIGAGIGILAALGLNVIDRVIERNTDSISDRIVKYIAPNHLSVIYDFKKKYGAKS